MKSARPTQSLEFKLVLGQIGFVRLVLSDWFCQIEFGQIEFCQIGAINGGHLGVGVCPGVEEVFHNRIVALWVQEVLRH